MPTCRSMHEQAVPETAVRKNRGLPHGKERFRFANPTGFAAVSEEKCSFKYIFFESKHISLDLGAISFQLSWMDR